MIYTEVLAKTEYQDLYRITDGVLLVVNKFTDIYKDKYYSIHDTGKEKKYGKGTQEWLRVLKFNHTNGEITIPKGTVTYHGSPVKPTKDKSEWKYEVKTTGNMFRGDIIEIQKLLNDILYTIGGTL